MILRFLTLFVCSLLLWTTQSSINHHMAQWQLGLFLGGLFICHAGFRMQPGQGLITSLAAGLLFDAAEPVPFGRNALLFALAFLVLLQLRPRLAHEETVVRCVVAILANSALYAARCLLEWQHMPGFWSIWGRLTWELALSGVLIALIGPWFMALEARLDSLADSPWPVTTGRQRD